MSEFNTGDVVTIVDKNYLRKYNKEYLIGKPLTISGFGADWKGDKLVRFKEDGFSCFDSRLELVTEPTDQELADKYRELSKEARDIRRKLEAKGLKCQARAEAERTWYNAGVAAPETQEWRFYKNETPAPVETIL